MSLRRIRLFIRDWTSEWGIAWSIARMRDCDRSGGHRWSRPQSDALGGVSRKCSRCKCSESIPPTFATATTYSIGDVKVTWTR